MKKTIATVASIFVFAVLLSACSADTPADDNTSTGTEVTTEE